MALFFTFTLPCAREQRPPRLVPVTPAYNFTPTTADAVFRVLFASRYNVVCIRFWKIHAEDQTFPFVLMVPCMHEETDASIDRLLLPDEVVELTSDERAQYVSHAVILLFAPVPVQTLS